MDYNLITLAIVIGLPVFVAGKVATDYFFPNLDQKVNDFFSPAVGWLVNRYSPPLKPRWWYRPFPGSCSACWEGKHQECVVEKYKCPCGPKIPEADVW